MTQRTRIATSALLAALVAGNAHAEGRSAEIALPQGQPQAAALSFGPLALVKFGAVYPEDAKANRISGWVAFRFHLSPEGVVENPSVVAAVQRDRFSRPSLNALLQWHFTKESGDASKGRRIGCALFLFQHPESPLDVKALADKIGGKLDCGRETVLHAIPGSGVFQ